MNEQPPRRRFVVTLAVLGLGVLALGTASIALFVVSRGLEQRLENAASQLSKHEDQARQHENLITTLTARLESAQDLTRELKQTMDRLNEGLNQAKDDFRRQLATADKTNGDLKLENSRLQLQISSLQKEIAGLEKQIDEQQVKIAGLERRSTEQQTEIVGLERRITEQQTEIANFEKQVTEQQREIAGLEKRIDEQQLEIADLKKRAADQQTQIADLKKRAADQQLEIANFKKRVADQQAEIVRLEDLLERRRREPFRNIVGILMVPIVDGDFQMGSPPGEPGRDDDEVLRLVRLTRPFHMAAHEVTQQQYAQVMEGRPWQGEMFVGSGPDLPATYVRWDQAAMFCDKLTEMTDIPGVRYHLPTEAQWEYACRAGTRTAFSFGIAAPKLGGLFEWLGPTNEPPQPVGRKKENPWGLFDMHGNVEEWCQDWAGGLGNEEIVDPRGPDMGIERVIRGGTINLPSKNARSADRDFGAYDDIRSSRGFRVARTYDRVPNGR